MLPENLFEAVGSANGCTDETKHKEEKSTCVATATVGSSLSQHPSSSNQHLPICHQQTLPTDAATKKTTRKSFQPASVSSIFYQQDNKETFFRTRICGLCNLFQSGSILYASTHLMNRRTWKSSDADRKVTLFACVLYWWGKLITHASARIPRARAYWFSSQRNNTANIRIVCLLKQCIIIFTVAYAAQRRHYLSGNHHASHLYFFFNVIFPGYNHLLTTSIDELHLLGR